MYGKFLIWLTTRLGNLCSRPCGLSFVCLHYLKSWQILFFQNKMDLPTIPICDSGRQITWLVLIPLHTFSNLWCFGKGRDCNRKGFIYTWLILVFAHFWRELPHIRLCVLTLVKRVAISEKFITFFPQCIAVLDPPSEQVPELSDDSLTHLTMAAMTETGKIKMDALCELTAKLQNNPGERSAFVKIRFGF